MSRTKLSSASKRIFIEDALAKVWRAGPPDTIEVSSRDLSRVIRMSGGPDISGCRINDFARKAGITELDVDGVSIGLDYRGGLWRMDRRQPAREAGEA